jgi:hypothetical protein
MKDFVEGSIKYCVTSIVLGTSCFDLSVTMTALLSPDVCWVHYTRAAFKFFENKNGSRLSGQ